MEDLDIRTGDPIARIDTPALLIDLDIVDANIEHIAGICRAAKVGWRPHIKGVKTPELALQQVRAGAMGVTCAKLGEAEIMAAAGIHDILVANQIVGEPKVARLIALAGRCEIMVAIDSTENLAPISAAAQAAGISVRVVIEVNIGLNRAGAEPGQAVSALAHQAVAMPGIRFEGLIGWEAKALLIVDPQEKANMVAHSIGLLTMSADLCRQAGIPISIVSCGGTGTLPYCAVQPGVTEIQAGGGIISDMHYLNDYHFDRPVALTVLTTVTSRPTPSRIILDVGRKSMSCDAAMPLPRNLGQVTSVQLSSEHTTIELAAPCATPGIGDKIELYAGYSDSTVHLHQTMYAIRAGSVEAAWPITARGQSK